MEGVVTVMTVSAAVVTIVWFVRDIRKENSKVLKAILGAQQSALEIQKTALEIQREEGELLARIEEGQRKGFEALAQIQRGGAEILARIEEGQRRGFESLAQLLVKVAAR